MQSSQSDSVVLLRKALRTDQGTDKDVLAELAPAFHRYNRNGLNLDVLFKTRLTRSERLFAFELNKQNMRAVVNASGFGWDTEEKMEELTDKSARFLLIRSAAGEELVGFVNFRFTLQGEMEGRMVGAAALFVYDIQLAPAVQRKGLGKFLMQVLITTHNCLLVTLAL
jgi:ribosomal protein S18 acetylase RimI-like enzyme